MAKLRRLIWQGHTLEVKHLYGLSTDDLLKEADLVLTLPHVPDEILTALSFHSDPQVRLNVCSYAGISLQLLRAMKSDNHPEVRATAHKLLLKRQYHGWKYQAFLFARLLHLPYRVSWAAAKLFVLYLVVGFAALFYYDTKDFLQSYKKSTGEMKAYALCTLSFKVLDQGHQSGDTCKAYHQQALAVQKRDPASTSFIEGDCPEGYSMQRGVHLPTCVINK